MARKPTQQDDQIDDDQTVLNGGPGDDDASRAGNEQQQQQAAAAPFDIDAFYERVVQGVTSTIDQKLANFQPVQHLQQQQAAPSGDDDFDTLLFTNPQQAFEKKFGEFEEKITKKYNDDRAQQQQDRAAAAFWDDFYAKNDDLDRKTDDVFVQGVMQANLAELSKITDPDKLTEALANKTRESLLAVSRRFKGGNGTNRTQTESGNGPGPSARNDDEDNLVPISTLLKARRAKRLKAAMG
jgi:hypothetical protein